MPSTMRERVGGRIAPEVTIQAEIGGKTIAFVELVGGCNEETLNARMDMYVRVIKRQINHQSLKEGLINLIAAKKTLAELPDRLRAALTDISIEREAFRAAKAMAHNRAGKRGDYVPTVADEREAGKFTDQMAAKEAEFDKVRHELETKIPQLEAQLANLERAVNGQDEVELLREDLAKYSEEGPLAVAAE